MGLKMSNAPVYFALAQVQFNPVTLMEKYINEVQDILRRKGYPLFEKQDVMQLQFLSINGQASGEPKIETVPTWLISKSDRRTGFTLHPNALTLRTTQYESSNEFLQELLMGLQAVHEVVQLDHINRLGMRYLDAILPRDGETVDQYLVEGFRGVEFGAAQRYSLYETVYETNCPPAQNQASLVARIYRVHDKLGYPPDVAQIGLPIAEKFIIKEACQHAVLDMDHFIEEKMPLDMQMIQAQLVSLHTMIRRAFDATCSDHARNVWR